MSWAKRIANNKFVKNSAILMNGNILGQAISFAFYLLLCRIYTPDDFGVLAIFMSFAGMFAVFSTGNYKYALLLPEVDREGIADKLIKICICFSISSAIVSVPVFLIWGYFSGDIGSSNILLCTILLPIYVFFNGVWELLIFWHIKAENFKLMANVQIAQNSISSILKAGLYFLKNGTGLIIGSALGQGLAAVIFLIKDKRPLRLLKQKSDFSDIKRTAKRFSLYPKYSMTRDAINYLGSNLVFFMLGSYFNMAEIGFFSMAMTLALRPLILVNNALNQNILQQVSNLMNNEQTIKPFIKKYLTAAGCIAIPAFAILYFVVKPLCILLLGQTWEQTGVFIQYMLPWLLVLNIFSPLSNISDLLGRQKTDMIFEVCGVLLRAVALSIGIALNDFNFAIIAYCASSFVITLCRGIWYVYIACTHKYPEQEW